jgi:phosphomevalonate kinase
MMRKITASAPGKLVLTGEYAVLEGAPAVSAAVEVRARVDLELNDMGSYELRVVNTDENYLFEIEKSGVVHWQQDPGQYAAVLESALPQLLSAVSVDELAPFTVAIDTREFFERPESGELRKLGIGSSAAVAVSLTAALQVLTGEAPALANSLQVHAVFQGQKGSGIDVASSWLGGLICKSGDTIETLPWPDGLKVMAVSTGIAASTTEKLQQLDEFRRADEQAYKRVFDQLGDAARLAAQSWQSGSAESVLEAVSNYADSLQQLDEVSALGIWSQPHRELAGLAAEHDLVYKPSGAGGGDYGVAFSLSDDALGAFSASALKAGYQPATFGWSDAGVKISTG